METTKQLVKEISALSSSLSNATPKGSKDDKIWSVMNTKEGDTLHETFNRQFNALFGEDCRDSHGRLYHVRQGKLGMGLVVSYLLKVNWADFPLDLAELKLRRLIAELQHLQCVPELSLVIHVNCLLDERTHLAQHEPSTSQQSLRMLPTPRHLNFPFSAKLSTISTPDRLKRAALLRQRVPIQVHPQPVQSQLHKTHVESLSLLIVTVMMKLELSVSRQRHVSHLHVLRLFLTLVLSLQRLQPRRDVPL